MTLAAAIVCHDDATYLGATIGALGEVPTTVFVSRLAWGNGVPGDYAATIETARSAGATVIEGDWPDEQSHRRAVMEWAKQTGIQHLIIPDSDEILSASLLDSLKRIAAVDLADAVYCTMDTYWKSPEYVVAPRERLMPAIMVSPQTAVHQYIRDFTGQRPLMLSEHHGVLHHLSYSGPESRIARKVSTWSHKDELVPHWWRDVWKRWDRERNLGNLHPTHPTAYQQVRRSPASGELAPAWDAYLLACGGSDPLHPELSEEIAQALKVSVIIPLYGGPEDLRLCLESLERCKDLLYEVIVVDDCSPDDAPDIVREFKFAKLIRNKENRGFAVTCNTGAAKAKGDVLLFLNSDTIVPRRGLIELLNSLGKTPVIGAVGPVSNAVGHFQYLPVTYDTLEGIDGFADDVARTDRPDLDVDMLVGFCLAVRRSAWDEVGPFDEQFRVGMFEDNDLCYRLRRAGYRLALSSRSFVHHRGNASLDRHESDKVRVFHENKDRFAKKWARDLDTGFASMLSGQTAERIVFDESRRPERLERAVRELASKAKVSLCMIVRNEERVLADCLRSAAPFFSQIVVVDTGSTDKTVEIAKSFGAEVHEMVWPDSFAAARNESLKHASGDWICWLDADDTLPFAAGEAIMGAVMHAPAHIGGLIMPVRFVNDDPEFGTSVDHVKVFRNGRGFQFEHRIHEQILPAIRAAGLDVARLEAEVLHTGYDTSEEGQAKKRERDEKLLKLDLADHPGHPFVLFNLGMTAHYNGAHAEAVDWLKQSLDASVQGESHIRKAYALWAVSVREQGDHQGALEVVQQGLKAVPDDPELLFHQGILLANLGRHTEAAASYERVLQAGKGMYFASVDSGIFGFKTWFNLAGIYAKLGDYPKAKLNYEKAMQSNPRYHDSVHALFGLATAHQDWPTSENCMEHVRHTSGEASAEFQGMLEHYRNCRDMN